MEFLPFHLFISFFIYFSRLVFLIAALRLTFHPNMNLFCRVVIKNKRCSHVSKLRNRIAKLFSYNIKDYVSQGIRKQFKTTVRLLLRCAASLLIIHLQVTFRELHTCRLNIKEPVWFSFVSSIFTVEPGE